VESLLPQKEQTMKRSFIREILEHTDAHTISFAGGLPDVGLFPSQALQVAAQKALATPEALQYSTSTGYAPLKFLIAQHYCDKGFATTADEILITSGSQQGLDIICRYQRGVAMTLESPSYLGALNIFTLNNIRTYGVLLGEDGIDLEAFKKSINHTALTYIIPDFQNPSGTCYTASHRRDIATVLKDSDTLLIEDAPYSELYFDQSYPSISQLLPTQSYHLGSFSKVLAPALRIGWIRADTSLIQPLIAYKEAMDLHTSSITQRIVYEYLLDTEGYQTHLATLRTHYQQKMNHFADLLDKYLPNFHYARPKGGMFIYGKLEGIDTMKLVRECIEHGVVFVPGCEFGGAFDEIRFNYTHSTFEEMERGLKRIKAVLTQTTIV